MKKDGRLYLIHYYNGSPYIQDNYRWEIVRWASAAMITPELKTWCTQSGLGIKLDRILLYRELDDVLKECGLVVSK